MTPSCKVCYWYTPPISEGAVGDLYYDYGEPPECGKVPGRANIPSFPFKNTKCQEFDLRIQCKAKLPTGVQCMKVSPESGGLCRIHQGGKPGSAQ